MSYKYLQYLQMADELDLGLEEEMALDEETAQEGMPVDPQEPPVAHGDGP